MSVFTIEVKDEGVKDALQVLIGRVAKPKPILQFIGEGIEERTKRRFTTSIGPDGVRWAPNARSTIEAYIASKGGIGKRGKITRKGIDLATNKKPLIGESRDLSRQFYVLADQASVSVGNSMIYAAIHQFGGQAGKGKKVKIPARPSLPIRANGELHDADRILILDQLNQYFSGR